MAKKLFPVCMKSDIAEGGSHRFELDGREFLICNINGNLHAVDGVCPHRGALLIQGDLAGKAVSCPWHGWEFDVETGEGITNPAAHLCTYSIVMEDDTVCIELEESEI